MFGKLATLAWYLQRPRLYPQQLRDWQEKFVYGKAPFNHSRAEAEQWCAARAINTDAAVQKIVGRLPGGRIADLFPEVFAAARRQQAQCPVWMGGAGDLNLIYWLAHYTNAARIVETGVAFGWSSLAFLLATRERADARLVSVDMPYPKINNDRYVGCVVPEDLRARWTLLRYADREGLPRALGLLGGIDLCHYDSDKRYRSRMWAYPRLWQALRPGGLLISDDIGDNVAFRDYCQQGDAQPTIVAIDNKFVGVLVKSGLPASVAAAHARG
jgi:predicted O-methyltransferase YrrM